jgi:membrane protease YdiL (CAAX protease family)
MPVLVSSVDDLPGTAPRRTVANPTRAVRLVRRAPLTTFLILSCVLSWWPAALQLAGVPLPGPAVTGFGPFLAVVVVLGLTQGRAGIGRLLRSMLRWRVPARAVLAALALPLLVSGSAILLTVALGGARPDDSQLALWPNIPVLLLLVLLVPGIGGAWEEPGWRGFALGHFERRWGAPAGALSLGVFWVFWHAPLFLTGDVLWPDVLVIVAASVVVAALYRSARDSVLIAMLFHATNNAVGGGYASQLFHGRDQVSLGLLTAAGWWLIAGWVIIRSRRGRTRPAPAPPSAG